MRESFIFQMNPTFIIGDTQNLQVLKEKITRDATLLSQIKVDYDKDPDNFKNEFISAKINHLKNQLIYINKYDILIKIK